MLSLFEEGGGYYLDFENGMVYYILFEGEDMEILDVWLGVKEVFVIFVGIYDEFVYDIVFEDISFVYIIWFKFGEGYGYVD